MALFRALARPVSRPKLPSPESGKGFLAAGFLLRRNRAIRLLPVRDFCSGAYTRQCQAAETNQNLFMALRESARAYWLTVAHAQP